MKVLGEHWLGPASSSVETGRLTAAVMAVMTKCLPDAINLPRGPDPLFTVPLIHLAGPSLIGGSRPFREHPVSVCERRVLEENVCQGGTHASILTPYS